MSDVERHLYQDIQARRYQGQLRETNSPDSKSTMQQPATISIEVQLPEDVFRELQKYMDEHPKKTWDQAMTAATSLYLMQNGANSRAVNSAYLSTLFCDK